MTWLNQMNIYRFRAGNSSSSSHTSHYISVFLLSLCHSTATSLHSKCAHDSAVANLEQIAAVFRVGCLACPHTLVSEQKFHIIWQFDASTFGAIKTTHNSSWGYSDRTHTSWKWGLFGESLGDLSRNNTVTSPRAKPKAKPTLAPSNKAFQMWTIKINRKTF